MTRLLLDTSTMLWALTDPSRLSPTARAQLTDRRVELVVSAASAWEIATKHRLGRLPQADPIVGAYERNLRRLEATTISIRSDHCLLAGSLQWAHRDPFDRMLAAQCMIEALPLVTVDKAFASLGGVRTIW